MAVTRKQARLYSATIIGANMDLLALILVCLPLRTLLRFKSVSKQCYETIGSPDFQESRRKKISGGQIFYSRPLELDFISQYEWYVTSMTETLSHIKSLLNVRSVLSFHSYKGLVAIGFKIKNKVSLLVYNLTTRQYRTITQPQFSSTIRCKNFVDINIVFDPSHSEGYKLVYIWKQASCVRFAVYDSVNQAWRKCAYKILLSVEEHPESPKDDVIFSKVVFWKGKCHWAKWENYFHCLDLGTGKEQDMPELPNAFERGYGYEYDQPQNPDIFYFGVLGGDLSTIVPNDHHSLQVLKMESDYSKWSVKYSLNLSPLIARHPSVLNYAEDLVSPSEKYNLSVLSVLVDLNDIPPKFIISIPNNIIVCDNQGKTFKEIPDSSIRVKGASRKWWNSFDYLETYVPI